MADGPTDPMQEVQMASEGNPQVRPDERPERRADREWRSYAGGEQAHEGWTQDRSLAEDEVEALRALGAEADLQELSWAIQGGYRIQTVAGDPEMPSADQAAREYEQTKRRVIEGRASVQEAQEFIDFIEGAIPAGGSEASALRAALSEIESVPVAAVEQGQLRTTAERMKRIAGAALAARAGRAAPALSDIEPPKGI